MNENDNTPHHDYIGSFSIREGLEEILEKSCHLMAQEGFHGTSMRDLAGATGRSLSGLYHYFRSKEDLLFLINLHGFRTLNDTWSRLSVRFADPREKLYAFVFSHMSYFAEHMDEMRVMTWGTHVLNLEKARMIQKIKDDYTSAAGEVVAGVYRDLTGKEIDEKRRSRETYLLFGMMNWTFGWYSPKKHGALSDLIADIYQTFLLGLSGAESDRSGLERMRTAAEELFRKNKTSSMWAAFPGNGE